MRHAVRRALRTARRNQTACTAAFVTAMCAAAPVTAETVTVQPGDTFSGIAARIEGDLRRWKRLYDPARSRLANPNLILPGMVFELVDDGSRRYLKLVSGGAHAVVAGASKSAEIRTEPKAESKPDPKAEPAATTSGPAPAEPTTAPPPMPASLVIGVVPNIASATLMTQYANVKSYLERRKVVERADVLVPANFKAFFDAMMRGDYDVSIAPPHFARVAQLDGGLVPIATYEPRIAAQFIVPADSPITGLADVRGKPIAFANPTSLVAMYGQQWLRQSQLEAGKDYDVVPARTDVGVGRLLLSGEAAGAIMSNGELRALPQEESSRLRIVEVFARIPNFIVLAHPRLGKAAIATLKSQWLGLSTDPDEGAAFKRDTGLGGVVEPDEAVLKELDAYVAPTRKVMGVAK